MKAFLTVRVIASASACLLSLAAVVTLPSTARAQGEPGCFMINQYGQVLDLSSLCGFASPPAVPQPEPQIGSPAVVDQSGDQATEQPTEDSSTYVGNRQPETMPTASSPAKKREEELYRGYQDVLRGSTLENRQIFRRALVETESEMGK